MADFRVWFPGEGETEADARDVSFPDPHAWHADLAAQEAVEQYRSGPDHAGLIGGQIRVAVWHSSGALTLWDVSVVATIDYHAYEANEGGPRG